jgi:hypothetical protein
LLMLYWFGIIIATNNPLSIVEGQYKGTLAIDAAVAIFSCGSDVRSSWRDLQRYNYDNK